MSNENKIKCESVWCKTCLTEAFLWKCSHSARAETGAACICSDPARRTTCVGDVERCGSRDLVPSSARCDRVLPPLQRVGRTRTPSPVDLLERDRRKEGGRLPHTRCDHRTLRITSHFHYYILSSFCYISNKRELSP